MIGSGVLARKRSWIVLCLGLLGAASAAQAAECPGHPDALGTSRTIVVDPREHPRIGTMQYRETLPLRDHEVVLTFDDGPLPKYSNQVLKILADECIKATFFIIGKQAQADPEGVRKLIAAGHTVGTHSYSHPLTFEKMPIDKAEAEINGGIQWTTAAMTDPSALAPFFRIPGLLRADGVENYLISRGIQVWSADFPADDWRHISAERVHQLAMQRLEAKGKGILLLHDIQARTVAALPKIIHDLKAGGYHIVNVVPATAGRPATPTVAMEWLLHPPTETAAIAHWPKVPPAFAFAHAETLPAPALTDLNAQVPRQPSLPVRATAMASAAPLPVPGPDVFKIPESLAVLVATPFHRPASTTRVVSAESGRARSGMSAKGRKSKVAAHGRQTASHTPAKRAPQGGRADGESTGEHPTRLASLKKRSTAP
jgi:peptidoglycan/xylan/chitin deacetylase (PgdA/CDA1 family)